jgi:hypothetical protein
MPVDIGRTNDYSGTIAAGGVSQVLMPANSLRRFLFIHNCGTATLYIRFGKSATTDYQSVKLVPDARWQSDADGFVHIDSISIASPTTGAVFTAIEGAVDNNKPPTVKVVS